MRLTLLLMGALNSISSRLKAHLPGIAVLMLTVDIYVAAMQLKLLSDPVRNLYEIFTSFSATPQKKRKKKKTNKKWCQVSQNVTRVQVGGFL